MSQDSKLLYREDAFKEWVTGSFEERRQEIALALKEHLQRENVCTSMKLIATHESYAVTVSKDGTMTRFDLKFEDKPVVVRSFTVGRPESITEKDVHAMRLEAAVKDILKGKSPTNFGEIASSTEYNDSVIIEMLQRIMEGYTLWDKYRLDNLPQITKSLWRDLSQIESRNWKTESLNVIDDRARGLSGYLKRVTHNEVTQSVSKTLDTMKFWLGHAESIDKNKLNGVCKSLVECLKNIDLIITYECHRLGGG